MSCDSTGSTTTVKTGKTQKKRKGGSEASATSEQATNQATTKQFVFLEPKGEPRVSVKAREQAQRRNKQTNKQQASTCYAAAAECRCER